MQSRNWIPALMLAGLFALLSTASNAQEAIGKATAVKPQADGSHGGTLSGGANVYSAETIRTGDTGQADLRFHDSSNLSVGPKSSIRLDKFVYDPNKSTGTIAIRSDPRLVSICDGITGQRVLSGQDSLWHPWRARLRNRRGGCAIIPQPPRLEVPIACSRLTESGLTPEGLDR